MNAAQVLELLGFATVPLFLLLDPLISRRESAPIRLWRPKAAVYTAVIVVWSTFLAVKVGQMLPARSVFDASEIGAWGAILGVLVYELGHYWYHRLAHQWTPLWRAGHQMHHMLTRMDAYGAYWLHPFDAMAFTLVQLVVFYPLLGLSPEAGGIAALFITFNALFQHLAIRTPHWLGFFIQRPEAHAIHHARGIHARNYSDLPFWDMVFGSFDNPKESTSLPKVLGFQDNGETRLLEALCFRDVSNPASSSTKT